MANSNQCRRSSLRTPRSSQNLRSRRRRRSERQAVAAALSCNGAFADGAQPRTGFPRHERLVESTRDEARHTALRQDVDCQLFNDFTTISLRALPRTDYSFLGPFPASTTVALHRSRLCSSDRLASSANHTLHHPLLPQQVDHQAPWPFSSAFTGLDTFDIPGALRHTFNREADRAKHAMR